MTLYLIAVGIVLCLCMSAFFSSAEMSYSSCNTLRLENARDGGSKRAAVACGIIGKFDDALSAILIGNNLANIAGSSLASVFVIMLFGSEEYTWIATAAMTLLVIVFGETIPKITAKKSANRLALSYSYTVRALMVVLRPLIWVIVGLIHLLTRSLKGEKGADGEEAVEELQSIIETAEDEDVLDEDRSELLQAAIDFSEISAFEVMTARVDVCAIDIDDDWEDIISAVDRSVYSRLPVYEGSIDNIIGILSMNHFLKSLTEDMRGTDIRSLVLKPCYVYKTMKLPAVLSQLRKSKQHLAIVVDEYGGTLGVISMEDVLEQIVGEIWDDTDEIEQEVVERSKGEYELDGDMVIADFLELTDIPEDSFEAESDTVGGWTIESFGKFPKVGDSFVFRGMTVTVMAMDALRVEKVLVKIDQGQK